MDLMHQRLLVGLRADSDDDQRYDNEEIDDGKSESDNC